MPQKGGLGPWFRTAGVPGMVLPELGTQTLTGQVAMLCSHCVMLRSSVTLSFREPGNLLLRRSDELWEEPRKSVLSTSD